MTINNTSIVDTSSKYNVQSTGIGSETNQVLVDASKLKEATNESLISLIECYYLIEGTGTLTISGSTAPGQTNDLSFTGKGKYGLRPDQLKFGNDKQLLLTTDSDVKSYLLVTEFRRNN
jgi:hypothetical protein|tara:strand:+ start:172 stop:528 length:357 start_codon:yes stop_codon:yes gene_type:complete